MATRILVLVPVLLFSLAVSTFAQATFSVGSIPVTAVTASGLTERAGDISLTQISGVSNSGTIVLNYSVPITVPSSLIQITGSGGYAGVVSILTLNNNSGIMVIGVPPGVGGGAITVSGVRVAVAGAGLSNLVANVGATENGIVAGQTQVLVILSMAPGLASVGASPGVEGAIDAATRVVQTQPVASAKEGYLNAFRPQGSETTTSVMVRFRLSVLPPPGVTITFPATVNLAGSSWTTATSTGDTLGAAVAITSSSTSLNIYYRVATGTDPTLIETLAVPVTLSVNASTLPLPPATVSYSCSLAPIGTAFAADGAVLDAPIPRFALSEIRPATLFQIAESSPPPVETISIGVRPVLNPKSRGVIPVAVFSTDSFDAAAVNVSTAFFGPTGVEAPALWAVKEELNGDGRIDLLLFFATEKTGILCGVTSVKLKAQTLGGSNLEGTDAIRTVPCH